MKGKVSLCTTWDFPEQVSWASVQYIIAQDRSRLLCNKHNSSRRDSILAYLERWHNDIQTTSPYNLSDVVSACGPAEYRTGQECCPMCSAGHFVKRTCTETTSTTCVPCQNSTFIDKPNGLTKCFSCSVCESGVGLRVKRACSTTSNTLCEPLEGHYCTDPNKDGCRGAEKHTECKPGQYIKQPATAYTDTICDDCGNDHTYSDGSFTFCKPHTRCETLGLFTKTLGTHTADAECEMRRHHMVLWTPLVLVFIIITMLVLSRRFTEIKTHNGCVIC